MTMAIMSITAIGGTDGRRPLFIGAIAQHGVDHLDRWVALHDNRDFGKLVRLRDPKTDTFRCVGKPGSAGASRGRCHGGSPPQRGYVHRDQTRAARG